MKTPPSNVITIHLSDYRYGVMLASHGIGFRELSEDWPEVLESEYAMRGYRDTWKRGGYADGDMEVAYWALMERIRQSKGDRR